jgi:hypothetical protein
MIDRSYNRTPAGPGHRYAPRHLAQRPTDDVETPVVQPQSEPVEPPITPVSQQKRAASSTKPAHPRQSRSLVLKRKGLNSPIVVAPAVIVSAPNIPKRRRARLHPVAATVHPVFVLTGAAVLAAVLVFGGGLLLFKSKGGGQDKYSLSQAHDGGAETLGASTTRDTNEIKPSAAEMVNYKTPPQDPRLLTIAKLQMSARVVGLDVGKDGLPTSTQNIFDTSWLRTSAKPGENGVTLISGKVAGEAKTGVFGQLESLAVGDVIQIERGDGKVISYKVAKLTKYNPAQLDEATLMKPATAGKSGLNLVTANSRYITKTNSFEQRLLVQAVQQ